MNMIKKFLKEEDGLATIEIGIILAVVVALAVVFRKQIASIWGTVFGQLDDQANKAGEMPDIAGDE